MTKRKFITFDWAMKRLLRDKANFGILEGFLSELLGTDLKVKKIIESESNKISDEDKYNRVDMLVELENGEMVLIDIQVNSEFDYFYRMLYGISKIVTEYMKEGGRYDNIKKIYSVNILYFDLGHGKDYVYHGTTRFIGLHEQDELELNKKQQDIYKTTKIHKIYPEYYLLKVNQFDDHAKNTLDEWIYFLKNEEIKDNFRAKGLREAKKKLDYLKLPEAERKSYERYLDNEIYRNSMARTAELEEFFRQRDLKEAAERGLAEGIERGKAEGLVEGEIAGQLREKRAIAKRMKDTGISPEVIQQITGISPDEMN